MKIDPTVRSSHFFRQAVGNVKTDQGLSSFDAVLQNKLKETGSSEVCTGSSTSCMTGPRAVMGVHPGPEISARAQAQVLLDKLEDYQKMLADPALSLRQIQPAVEQMEKQAGETRPLISGMPDGHPLKTILQDAIANIDQEITRFSSGYYIDD